MVSRLTSKDLKDFEKFVNAKGFETRPHSSMIHRGIQVFFEGHWMAVVWNKNWGSYTVDKRLQQFYSDFRKATL